MRLLPPPRELACEVPPEVSRKKFLGETALSSNSMGEFEIVLR
jgi:hypothetical protein